MNGKALVWLKYRFIGDAVMATPLLRAVYSSHDQCVVIAASHLSNLFGNEPYAGCIDPVGKISGLAGFFRQVKSLKRAKFQRVFLVNRSARSALISRMAGMTERIGHDTEGRGALLTHRASYDLDKFEASCYGDLARLVNLSCDDSRVFLQSSGAEQAPDLVGVQPGSTALHKAIPPTQLAALVNELHQRGKRVVFLGGKEEASYLEALYPFILDLSKTENLIGACSLQETMRKIESLGQIFCGDTGLVHIAAGLGTPSVSVFAGTPASKWGHHYEPHQVIDVRSNDIAELKAERLIEAIR